MNPATDPINTSNYNLNANLNGQETNRIEVAQQILLSHQRSKSTNNPFELFKSKNQQNFINNISHFKQEIQYDRTTNNMSKVDILKINNHRNQSNWKFVAENPVSTSERENPERKTCQICYNQLSGNRQTLTNCQHADKFCESCLYNHLTNKISQFQQATCPQQNCKEQINVQGSLFKNYPNTVQIRYNKIKRFYSTIRDSTIRLCPSIDCDGILKIEKDVSSQCKICRNQFCSVCLLTLHQGPCDEHQKTFLIQNLRYRQCIKCKMMIQKFKGCNQMTCLCKYQFCYICQSQWTQSHHGKHDNKGNLIIMNCWDICLLVLKIIVCFPLWILTFLVIYTPLIVLQIIVVIAVSIFRGLFMQPCLMKPNIQLNKIMYAIILVIFYPVFAVIGMVSSLRKMCEQESQTVFIVCSCDNGKNNLINCLCSILDWIFQKD